MPWSNGIYPRNVRVVQYMQLSPSILESLNLLLIYFTQLWLLSVSIGFYNQGQGFPTLLLHAAAAESLQSCPTLCDPIHGSPPGSSVPGILQARILEWVAISFSNAWKWKVKVKSLSLSNSLRLHGLQPTRLLHPWDFPGKSTGVGCHCLLHTLGSFQT